MCSLFFLRGVELDLYDMESDLQGMELVTFWNLLLRYEIYNY